MEQKTRATLLGLVLGLLTAAAMFALVLGLVNVFMTTSPGRAMAEQLLREGHGPYRYAYSQVGTIVGPICAVAFIGALMWTQRRGARRPVGFLAVLIAGAGASWGYWLYAMHAGRSATTGEAIRASAAREKVELEALGRAYHAAVTAADVGRMLDAKSLASAPEIADGKRRLATLSAAIEKVETDVTATSNKARGDIAALPGDGPDKREAIAAFDADEDSGMTRLRAFLAAERELVAGVAAVLAFAEARAGQLRVDGGTLKFKTAAEAQKYSALVGWVNAAADREQASLQALRAGKNASL